MPHLLLRTSADLVENVDIHDILARLVEVFSAMETVSSKDLKAYHEMHSNWSMGEGAPAGFAHLTVSVLTGRPPELLKQMGDAMFAEMNKLFASSIESSEARPTVELRQMPKETYWK